MKSEIVPDILHFSAEAFSQLTPDEFCAMILISYFQRPDFTIAKRYLGIGMDKYASILRSLRDKGYITYRPGRPETALSTGAIDSDEIGSIPKWVFLSRDLLGHSKEKFIYAYLHTFMRSDRVVIKKRKEIEKVLNIKKTTVKNVIAHLEKAGFLSKKREPKNQIRFELFEKQKISFLRSVLGG